MKYEDKIAAGRLPCLVPGCQRTFAPDGSTEIICGQHWKAVPKRLRRRVEWIRRRYRAKFGDVSAWSFPAGSPKRLEAVRYIRAFRAAWGAAKTSAIEKALGI